MKSSRKTEGANAGGLHPLVSPLPPNVGRLEQAKCHALHNFDEWNSVTGFPEPHTSYYYEIASLIEDAVEFGFGVAHGQTFKEIKRRIKRANKDCADARAEAEPLTAPRAVAPTESDSAADKALKALLCCKQWTEWDEGMEQNKPYKGNLDHRLCVIEEAIEALLGNQAADARPAVDERAGRRNDRSQARRENQ